MKTPLRSYIFSFLIMLIVTMALSFFMIFRISALEYMNVTARQHVVNSLNSAKRQFEKAENIDRKIFLSDNILLYDNRMNLVHPKDPDAEEQGISGCFIEHFHSNQVLPGEIPFLLSCGNTDYLLKAIPVNSSNDYQAAYAVGYHRLYKDDFFLHQIENLVMLITVLLTMVFVPLFWLFSGHLVKPLRRLQGYSRQLGAGDFQIPRINSPIREIEELSATFSAMAQELRELISAQEAFFQNTSHELRMPLMSIEGYAQGIREDIFPDRTMAADVIIMESERMKQLIDEILTLARLDAREQKINLEQIEIYDFLTQMIQRVRGISLRLNHEIIFQPLKKELYICTDPMLLEKVCSNLLSNALRHAKKNIYVDIFEHREHVCIAIENDGLPLSEEELGGLFNRFYRGDNGSFGIGLSLVKSAMDYMNGNINVKNGIHGARFMVWFKISIE